MSDLPTRRVLSASRTRDPVHRCPDHLAELIKGETQLRLGRHLPSETIDPAEIGVLVLWTKQPRSLLESRPLRAALRTLCGDHGALVDLQLTVTGFGSGPVEPGIPLPDEVAATLGRIFDAGLVDPRLVKLRIDPLATVSFDAGPVYSNTRKAVIDRILDTFAALGVRRVTASMLDDVEYRSVRERMSTIGARVKPVDAATGLAVAEYLSSACSSRSMSFHTCVTPDVPSETGCIEGGLYNRILEQKGAAFRVTDALHNSMGSQRVGCSCTYSHDLASSKGVQLCATGGFGCVYCYAHGPSIGPALRPAVDAALDRAVAGNDLCWARL